MSWTVIIPEDIEKEIENIHDENLRNKILDKLEVIENDPYPHLNKMRKHPYYKFKVKNYRVIVSISNKKLIVNVLRIRHRNTAYRGLDELKKHN